LETKFSHFLLWLARNAEADQLQSAEMEQQFRKALATNLVREMPGRRPARVATYYPASRHKFKTCRRIAEFFPFFALGSAKHLRLRGIGGD
jgi:hypothetical protein